MTLPDTLIVGLKSYHWPIDTPHRESGPQDVKNISICLVLQPSIIHHPYIHVHPHHPSFTYHQSSISHHLLQWCATCMMVPVFPSSPKCSCLPPPSPRLNTKHGWSIILCNNIRWSSDLLSLMILKQKRKISGHVVTHGSSPKLNQTELYNCFHVIDSQEWRLRVETCYRILYIPHVLGSFQLIIVGQGNKGRNEV